MKRLAIVCTHPIQYYAPVFKLLAQRKNIAVKVFYTWGEQSQNKYDPGFGKIIEWDIPLLENYDYVFIRNTSIDPGSHHYKGIINPTLLQEVKAWKPDAVLVYGWNYHSHLYLMRKLKGKIPIWFRGDSHLLDPLPWWKQWVKKMVLSWVYRHVDVAFYVGTQNKRYYQAFGLKDQQLVFAPHAIDNERFFDTPERGYAKRANEWRNLFGFQEEDVIILFAGKFEPKKAPLQLLEAVQAFNKEHDQPFKLLLVGNGILESTLKQRAEGDPNVRFLEFQNQSQMPVVYRIGNIYCLPSLGPGETWGLAVNEAMACNLPIIISDRVGCGLDLIKDGISGRIFQHNDVSALLECLKQMAKDIPMRTKYSQSKELIQNWSFKQQVIAFEHQLIQN